MKTRVIIKIMLIILSVLALEYVVASAMFKSISDRRLADIVSTGIGIIIGWFGYDYIVRNT